jgi:hypothetical protein
MAARHNPDRLIRSSTGEPGLSLWHLLEGAFLRAFQVVQFNAPTLHSGPIPAPFLSGFSARFSQPQTTHFQGRKVLVRSLVRGGVVVLEPFLG